jgi:hypothetical protein
MGSNICCNRFFASFSIGQNDKLASLVSFFLVFFLPIISSLLARWFIRNLLKK